jgi:hypothetical protein
MNQSPEELVRQKFDTHFKKKVELKKGKTILLETSTANIVGTVNPLPENCLENTKLYDLKYLNPIFSIEGNVVNNKYKELKFHFLTCPVNLDYVDYRLLEDNRYAVLGTNIHRVSDYDTYDDFLNALSYDNNEHFDGEPESISVGIKKDNSDYDAFKLNIEKCNWCQGTYLITEEDSEEKLTSYVEEFIAQNLEDDSVQKYLNEDFEIYQKDLFEDGYSKEECLSFSIENLKAYLFDEFCFDLKKDGDQTDYSLDDLKDENGDPLEFVASISTGFDIFGSYYLYYSPKTKLVRLFFQCT